MFYIFLFICGIGLIYFLVFLDLSLGLKSHKKHTCKHDFPVRHGKVEVFIDGPSLFEAMFKDIESAKDHIHMLFFIFRSDHFGKQMIALLEKKASEGVKIRLLLDWVGSFFFSRKMVRRLRESGIQVDFCHTPRFPFFIYFLQARNHRKITVIDGKIGYLGGFNVGKEYVNQDEKLNPWRDCHAKFVGDGVQDLQKQFLTDWMEKTKEVVGENSGYFPQLKKGPSRLCFHPYEGIHLERDLIELFKKAEKEIIIGSPYFVPSMEVFHALLDAINRNVKITLIVPFVSDHFLIQEASYRFLRKLLRLGCKVYQYKEGFYHAKIFIIDETVCSIGTANIDKRSFYFNHELNCFIYDHSVVLKIRDIAERDISKSSLLKLEQLNKFDIGRLIKEGIALLVSPLL